MILSAGAFSALVSIALIVTIAAPVLLFGLLVRDWTKGQLW